MSGGGDNSAIFVNSPRNYHTYPDIIPSVS